MKKVFVVLFLIGAVCISSMEREVQAQDILQKIYAKIDSVPRMETMRVDLDAIASDNDSIMKMLAVPATRRIDASADWSNATLTRAIHTVGADTFQGHFWSFALANDAAAACTLWTYCDGVADQGNDGWPIKPGESVGHLTNYPAPIDSFSFSKTAADLLKWIIIGR